MPISRTSRWLGSLLLGGAGMVAAQSGGPASVREADALLITSGDHFVLRLPLQTGGRTGRLTVTADLLDTQGVTRSHASAPCRLIAAATTCEVELPPAAKNLNHPDGDDPDLPLYRVRYSVALAGQEPIQGIMPLDRIAPGLFELHVAAPRSIRPGAHYIARVRAIHPHTALPRANVALEATVTVSYTGDKDDAIVDRVPVATDADGFASIPFTVPDGRDIESIDLDVQGAFANLKPGTTQTLRVPVNERFELTTDKPLYQPGQTVHTRMLLLDRNAHAAGGKTVRVDVRDPNRTLVYRATAATSEYGIATVDWEVPARIRLGEYTLDASLPDDEGNNSTASATVRVSRYDLPTFVVNPKPDRTFYLPGTNAVVDVRADYLFGKPVLHGHVRVVREDDRTWNYAQQRYDSNEGKAVAGELDKEGSFKAHIDLREDEKLDDDERLDRTEDIHLAAYVTDASTGRTEQRRFDLRLAQQALQVYVVQRSQAVGLAQQRYVSVTSADGTPVECDLTVSLLPQQTDGEKFAKRAARAIVLDRIHTDAHGLARISLPGYAELMKLRPPPTKAAASPDEDEMPELLLAARDGAGDAGSIVHPVQAPAALFRVATDRTIYRPGEAIGVTIDSAEAALPLTVQLVRSTQRGNMLLEMRTVTLTQGHAALTIPTDTRYTGAVFVNAIALGALEDKGQRGYQDWQTAVASRAVLFPRDNELHVGITMSAATYRPGAEAAAAITVRGPQDVDGDDIAPSASALGIVAVDRAVEERDRSDRDFGGSGQTFFFKSWNGYGGAAGGFTTASLQQLDLHQPLPEGAQLAAEILLANAGLEVDTTDNSASGNFANVFGALLGKQLDPARTALAKYLVDHTEVPVDERGLEELLAASGVDFAALRDPWGRPYTLLAHPDNFGQMKLVLASDGPDKLHGTADDFEIDLASWRWANSYAKQVAHAVDAWHQRTGGYIRTLADLRAEMQAEGIAFDQWRDPWNQPFLFRFSIAGTYFAVEFLTLGDPTAKPQYAWQHGPFSLGSERIDYTTDLRRKVDDALIAYTDKHSFPRNDAQLHAALREMDGLLDAWHHPLYATFRSRSAYADHTHTEAHAAAPGAVPEVRTTIVPVTEVTDIIDLWSAGPDGKRRTRDDFVFASFSAIRSQQSAQDAAPRHPARGTVHNGRVGDISGTVTDQSGADIVGVTVTATNLLSGAEFEAQCDKDGRYLLGPVPVGNYRLRFRRVGFNDLVYDRVVVELKGTASVDAKLAVGSTSETVTVTASSVTVDTMSASVAAMSTPQQLSNLPIAGRDALEMVRIAPGVGAPGGQPSATPRLREYFPETLLWRPEIITAADGTATVRFPVADNITTWLLSAAASTMEGNTGAGTAAFATFQPFFAAFDPPSILTTGDTIALPVTLRNYLDHAVSVESSIAPAPWFTLDGPATRTTLVASGQSASPVFRFTALAPVVDAKQEFIAKATDTGDRIARSVSVHPEGLESAVTASAVLAPGANTLTLALPADMLAGSGDATLKLYPNLGAHLRDGLAAMAAYPDGCAEQIISIAWPSLLIQRYTANLPRRDDTLRQKTHAYLERAYQNLLGNQLASGGFAYWTRDSDADIALTAYAVEFLHAAGEFIAVDPKVVSSAVAWLAKAQEKDGQWLTVDWQHRKHPEDTRANAMLTASVAAMIAGSPESEPPMRKAIAATQSFAAEFGEPYTLASYALAALALGDTGRSGPAIARLRSLALSEDGGAYWSLETNTPFYGWGRAGRVESSAQVLRALLAAGATAGDDLVARGMLFLDRQQDRQSLWYSTQATARVLDVLAAIALRTPVPAAGDGAGSLTVNIDGQAAKTVVLPQATVDGGPIFVPLGAALGSGEHRISLALPSSAQAATAQVVANFYRPWPATAASVVANHDQLRLTVAFSTRRPQPRQPVTVNAHIERIGFRGYDMMLAEIGLPPGADVDRASLESALGSQLNHYEILPDRVLLYVSPRAGGLNVRFRFTLRYGVDALTAPSRMYDYYNPDVHVDLAPVRFSGR